MEQRDYYLLLGLDSSASPEEVKKAFHRKALEHHPDRNPGDSQASERFRKVREAYEVLSNPAARESYDRSKRVDSFGRTIPVAEYLDALTDLKQVRLNEEVELTFSFPAEGRFFRKPVLQGWMITAGPTVSHRQLVREGQSIRETVLHYTVCPVTEGLLRIPSASISFQRHPVYSPALQVEVLPADCYFCKGAKAGYRPYQVKLHRMQVSSTSAYRKTRILTRTVLLPRSDVAAWYHRVARIMKVSLALTGGAWALLENESLWPGMLAGSLCAGINVQIMYRLMGIKSLFYHAARHPLVKEYEAMGYWPGSDPDETHFVNRTLRWIRSLLF